MLGWRLRGTFWSLSSKSSHGSPTPTSGFSPAFALSRRCKAQPSHTAQVALIRTSQLAHLTDVSQTLPRVTSTCATSLAEWASMTRRLLRSVVPMLLDDAIPIVVVSQVHGLSPQRL